MDCKGFNYIIREIEQSELRLLEDFLYEAIYLPKGTRHIPRDVVKEPRISVYIDNYGKKDVYCLVADMDGEIIGAVWVRILAGDVKGYGNIDEETPEFAISLFKGYRNKGIGTALMKKMIEYLREKGYKQTSLSVNKQNYAVKMYKTLGFEIIEEKNDDYLMILKLV